MRVEARERSSFVDGAQDALRFATEGTRGAGPSPETFRRADRATPIHTDRGGYVLLRGVVVRSGTNVPASDTARSRSRLREGDLALPRCLTAVPAPEIGNACRGRQFTPSWL